MIANIGLANQAGRKNVSRNVKGIREQIKMLDA
jgi:hypothetical protein